MKETVYEHLEGNETFTLTADEPWSIRMIKRLAEKHPDECVIIAENKDGSILAHVPYKWVKVSPPRTLNLSAEQRKELGERMSAMRRKQLQGETNETD